MPCAIHNMPRVKQHDTCHTTWCASAFTMPLDSCHASWCTRTTGYRAYNMDRPHTKMRWNATYNMHPSDKHTACTGRTPRLESWRAQRRYASSFSKQTELNLRTESSELAAKNSTLAAQCGTGVNAAATSDASLQDGSRWKCTRTRAYASPRSDAHAARLGPTCEYSEYPRVSTQSTPL